jgi:hypothetical protein
MHGPSAAGAARRMAVISLLGFACVIFTYTYLGVNYLDSLHSYF